MTPGSKTFFFPHGSIALVGQGLLSVEVPRSHSYHTWLDFSRRVVGPSQRPLPDTQRSQETYMTPAGFEPTIPAIARPQTHALDGAVTGTVIADCWRKIIRWLVILYFMVRHKSVNTLWGIRRLTHPLQDGGRGTHVTHFVQLYPQPLYVYTASQVRTTSRSWDKGVLTDLCLTGVLTDLCLTL